MAATLVWNCTYSTSADGFVDLFEDGCHSRLYIAVKYSQHRVVMRFKPFALVRPGFFGGLAFVGRHQIDHQPQRERYEVADVLADRRLALKDETGEAAVIDQSFPQHTFGFGRIAPQEPRQPAHRAALLRHPAGTVLGEQRAQHFGLRAVEHAAARWAFAAFGDRHDHAVQGLDVLLRRLHAG